MSDVADKNFSFYSMNSKNYNHLNNTATMLIGGGVVVLGFSVFILIMSIIEGKFIFDQNLASGSLLIGTGVGMKRVLCNLNAVDLS